MIIILMAFMDFNLPDWLKIIILPLNTRAFKSLVTQPCRTTLKFSFRVAVWVIWINIPHGTQKTHIISVC